MNTKNTVSFLSQGCRLNHSETAGLINEFKAKGFADVGLDDDPNIVVINTCTVTENGDKDTRRLVRKINEQCSSPRIALIGCQAQIKKNHLMDLKNVEWVIGNETKDQTARIILENNTGVHAPKFEQKSFFQDYSSFDPKHTRVNLKIQDGCDFYCSFCIIPFARGPARSRDFNNIIDDAKGLINLGVKELVLTGINLGTYQFGAFNFYDLLESLLQLNPGTRIRISSIEPTTIDNRLIQLWQKYSNFCRYLHLPIQSATDEVLKLMRRKYSLNEYLDYINDVRQTLPDMCIGTDVIVGFPGETAALFKSTKATLSRAPIDYFHVFSYSERSMAHSRKFENQNPPAEIKARSLALRGLHKIKWADFMRSKIGDVHHVLFEQIKQDQWVGTTEHFIKVFVKSDDNLKNKSLRVKLNAMTERGIEGELV
ncbi:MAG: tRNA (N(6)-L-threonylcarbamoyladenosine(37)-C(2))-methylthiotransferase MtaB [Candidatus Marinamargulisbacteria bacterium]